MLHIDTLHHYKFSMVLCFYILNKNTHIIFRNIFCWFVRKVLTIFYYFSSFCHEILYMLKSPTFILNYGNLSYFHCLMLSAMLF